MTGAWKRLMNGWSSAFTVSIDIAKTSLPSEFVHAVWMPAMPIGRPLAFAMRQRAGLPLS